MLVENVPPGELEKVFVEGENTIKEVSSGETCFVDPFIEDKIEIVVVD